MFLDYLIVMYGSNVPRGTLLLKLITLFALLFILLYNVLVQQ